MTFLRTIGLAIAAVFFALPVRAFEPCKFTFQIDTQSSAFQALVDGAAERGGFWRPIQEAPDDVQQIGRYIGRLDVCLITPDGKPRQVTMQGRSITLKSPFVTTCTAALLPENRLLTNRHCFFNDVTFDAGFSIVQEARINFGYVSKDFIDDVKTFLVSPRELAEDKARDALVLQIVGGDANAALNGHIPMVMEPRATPRRALTMVHHPGGAPQQFSSGTCQVHPAQATLPAGASQLRHSCETSGGSSGSLLLDARSLAVVGLHNQGGLTARGGGYNGGHKIAAVEAALGLGFRTATAPLPKPDPKPDPEAAAQAALAEALQVSGLQARRTALETMVARFPNSRAAISARNTLELMAPKAPTKEEQATAALIAALQLSDDSVKAAQLRVIEQKFAGTAAAGSARAVLKNLEKPAVQPVVTTAPVARPEPSTLTPSVTVKQDGTGDFRTIGEAVKAAKPGTRIAIYPGTYKGGVDVAKELELVGVGDREKIVWEAKDDFVIKWTAPAGRIANLSLRQMGGKFVGVYFDGGSALLENCDVTSLGYAVVAIRNGADPVLRNNLIRDGKASGVFVYNKGRGTLEGNEIFGNAFSGVEIRAEGDPVLRNNLIHDGKESGVFVHDKGRGTFEGNEIFGNANAGVEITTEGDPVLRNNVIRDGKSGGVHVYDKGLGTLEGNEIFGNARAGVSIKTEGDPVLRNNVISGNGYEAVWIYEGGKGSIIGNDLRGNKRGAFDIEATAGTVIRRDNKE